MTGVKIPVEATLQQGDIEKVVQKLTEQINRLGNSVAQANKIKFNPISQATVDDVQKVTRQFDSLRKISGDLNKRLNATGQGGAGFFDIDWSKVYHDPRVRAQQQRKLFEYVMAGTGASFTGGSPGPAPRPPRTPPPPPSPGASWRSAGRNVVGAGLRAFGPAGGVADSALSSGLSGGITAGIAGLIGGVVALGIGKAIGGVISKIGEAQNDMIGYDTLKRALGDVNVGFGMLRQSLHASSDAIDVSYAQVLKLGNEFAHISGISGEMSKNLAEEVRVGGGFGRSFGVDPSQSNAFFAQMRLFQVTNTDGESRRLALYIGEAIAKSGAFAKTDQMLQAIASYTSQQTRLGLTTANVGDYSGLLAGLVGSHTPGLDPIGAAGLLSRVNGSIASGGGAGEAGQNFMYMALGRQLGLDPIQASILREQGAFGTGAVTFGKGSLYAKFATKYGLNTPAVAAGSSATNLQMVMRRMQSIYSGRPELMLSAMSNLFGVNTSQAMALATIGPDKLGGLQQSLAANGVDLSKMSATGISSLAQIFNGNAGTLSDQAAQLRPQLSDKDAASLDQAEQGGDTEKFRSELIKLTARYGQVQTEGSETRKTIQDLDKDMMDAASKMIGPLNTMRDTLLYAFGKRGSMTADDMHKAVIDAQRKQINARADARIGEAQSKLLKTGSFWGGGGLDASAVIPTEDYKKAYAHVQSETAAANRDRARQLASLEDPNLLRELAKTDRIVGLTPGTSAAQMMQESKFNARALSSKGAMGMAQVMPDTLAALEKRLGRKLDPYNPEDAVVIQRELMRENMKKFGNQTDALKAYNGGWDKSTWGNSETTNYPSNVASYIPYFANAGTPLPDGGAGPQAGRNQSMTVNLEGNFTLTHPNGQPAAAPVSVNKLVRPPSPFGN